MSRWTLSRAGIINVYQYENETLTFGGGRLLLRGVNGSGKSTAMNMLLPFLLDADTRRIDAAGEQSGVLRSWMLSGRDEQQPQGYLWLELANGAEHLAFGCGIRANRSTDRVTTWWFVTERRPGIDVQLVERRHALSADALRSVLEPGAVYSHDQRATYRAELRNRLFGGADLDQHLRLIHTIRSPRVGDRIDLDLPQYLDDALPQLSDTALDDAAQPLEDLEEHRRNVEDLRRTAQALDAIGAVYANYARTELHRAADAALALVADHTAAAQQEAAAGRARQAAAHQLVAATTVREQADAAVRRFTDEIRALEASDAYRAGAELHDLRNHVTSLAPKLADAEATVERHTRHLDDATAAVGRAARDADDDTARLTAVLDELRSAAADSGLTARPPSIPGIVTHRLAAEGPAVPTEPLGTESFGHELAVVRAAAQVRVGDIRAVQQATATVDRAVAALELARRQLDAADADVARTEDGFARARAALAEATDRWHHDVGAWRARLDEHTSTHDIPTTADEPPEGPPDAVHRHLTVAVAAVVDEHHRRVASTAAELRSRSERVDELSAELDELRSRTLPDPPTAPWQQPTEARRVAELVDFRDDVPAADRAGLEAALEAAGLLAAEVHADGSLVLADGQLLATPAKSAPSPTLADLLVVTPPDDADPAADAVERLLSAISVDAAMLPLDDVPVVTVAGEFRLGPLRGRHAKPAAEHIGLAARRAALEHQRDVAERELTTARTELGHLEEGHRAERDALDEARQLHDDLPPLAPITAAAHRSDLAQEALHTTRERRDEHRRDLASADDHHARAIDHRQRVATDHGLPTDAESLDQVAGLVAGIRHECDAAATGVEALARAVLRWIDRGREWERARSEAEASRRRAAELADELRQLQSRLATLEDSIGTDYDEVVAALATSRTDLDAAEKALDAAHHEERTATGAAERSAEQHTVATAARLDAAHRCVAALPRLRAVAAVPGLLSAAAPDGDTEVPTVEETPDGVARFADALRRLASHPDAPPTTAEGVRMSLRGRRDSLGAGWDAEDHQPDDALPLHVEVTGPLGRSPLPAAAAQVASQLAHMSSLLSTKQDQALRNLLQGLIAREVAEKLHAARELVDRMNARLADITTSHGIGITLRWRRRDDLDPALAGTIDLLAKPPDLRTADEDRSLVAALSERIATARRDDPEVPYRDLIADALDYRAWHHMSLYVRRPGRNDERLTRRTALSEGEKKMVSYLPLFAAVAASCDALAEHAPEAPRFVLLDDAFAKVSEDNHAKLFGLLVELDLDVIATSERLWGTHETVPELAIVEVIRDADLGAIVLEHFRWDGRDRVSA